MLPDTESIEKRGDLLSLQRTVRERPRVRRVCAERGAAGGLVPTRDWKDNTKCKPYEKYPADAGGVIAQSAAAAATATTSTTTAAAISGDKKKAGGKASGKASGEASGKLAAATAVLAAAGAALRRSASGRRC